MVPSSVGDDQIYLLPDGGRSRYTPGLSVRRLREPPDLARLERDGFRPGTFQGEEALVYNGRSGEYDAYRVMPNRGGVWYQVSLSIPRGDSPAGSIPSPEWRRYLETFVPATAPAVTTRPSGGVE